MGCLCCFGQLPRFLPLKEGRCEGLGKDEINSKKQEHWIYNTIPLLRDGERKGGGDGAEHICFMDGVARLSR